MSRLVSGRGVIAKELDHRTLLSVPLLREGVAIGAIQLRRAETNPFTDKQITLLQTFADQAVIAIENVRLFTELQEKNRALTDAHAQVTEALERDPPRHEVRFLTASRGWGASCLLARVAHPRGASLAHRQSRM
jgi:GAF domain-containing protein